MLVDTNILARALQPHHPSCPVAEQALRYLPQQGHILHVVPQNLVELWVVATRPRGENGLGLTPSLAAIELSRIKAMFVFLPETALIYPAWETLVIRHGVVGKSCHDARLVAAMQVHGLTSILTFDRTGFSRFPGIQVVHPQDVRIERA